MTEEAVDELFAKIDLDGSGTIDYTEFVMATINE
jgi:Ca2+-binding EF-hand superfamily protein